MNLGNGEWGIGHGAWGMGHGALGWALIILPLLPLLPLLPHPPHLPHPLSKERLVGILPICRSYYLTSTPRRK
ncbi:hypothetical protein [Nostoc sp. UHCC 0251]|uniref:hypothetical protein n=1 Tax=Nostoc sp. UHCC 0251 TaxID=3110240 RepID=UPI002B21FBC2|nr:hypothetical protein [Nostoc sp. UHCC 0251]MEA5623328.1 hypothetical protein [Nostoc sp. UHCC 0251]